MVYHCKFAKTLRNNVTKKNVRSIFMRCRNLLQIQNNGSLLMKHIKIIMHHAGDEHGVIVIVEALLLIDGLKNMFEIGSR